MNRLDPRRTPMTCVAIKYHMWRTIIIIFFLWEFNGEKTLGILFYFIILGQKLVIPFLRF